jgi:glycerol uptake facilitator-like aquaporin
MCPIGFSWGAFFVYVCALVLVVGGGFIALIQSHHPAFLAPILVGLLYFYIAWEACVETGDSLPPAKRDGMRG